MRGASELAPRKNDFGCVLYYLIAAVSIICIIVGTRLSIFTYAGFVVISVYFFCATNENAVSLTFFLMPFANIFKTSPSNTSFFTYLTLLLVIKLFISKRMLQKNFFITWILFFAIQLIGSKMEFALLIKQASLLLLVYGYFNCCKPITKRLVLNCTMGIILSCCIAAMINLFPGVSDYMRYVYAYELGNDIQRFTGLHSDPNYLSQTLVVLCMALFALMQKKQIGGIGWVCCALMFFFGIQTISKSFFLMLAIVAVIFVIIAIKQRRYGLLLLLLSAFIVFIVLIVSQESNIFTNVIQRLLYSSDITSGRVVLWDKYITFLLENPLNLIFGVGISASHLGGLPHSTYLDFLYWYGIFGTIIFCIGLFYSIPKKTLCINVVSVAPAICLIITSTSLSNLLMYDFVFSLIIVIAFLTDGIVTSKNSNELENIST